MELTIASRGFYADFEHDERPCADGKQLVQSDTEAFMVNARDMYDAPCPPRLWPNGSSRSMFVCIGRARQFLLETSLVLVTFEHSLYCLWM